MLHSRDIEIASNLCVVRAAASGLVDKEDVKINSLKSVATKVDVRNW